MSEDESRSASAPQASALRRAAWRALGAMPEAVQIRVNPGKYGFTASDVPPPVEPPVTPVRLYIAPVNSAGQGYRWARAAESLQGVGATNMQFRTTDDFGFPADYAVSTLMFVRSKTWQKAQFRAVSKGYTHVIFESCRPIFGGLFDGDVEREVTALRAAGVTVGMVLHGSDIQLPSRHREQHEWSPFRGSAWDKTEQLERQAMESRRVLGAVDAPTFVSTPDLLDDWPSATVLPIVIEVDDWLTDAPLLTGEVPIVVHAPSRGAKKGTELIHDTMVRLAEEGLIDYREFSGVPASEMPTLVTGADILLDQFRIGVYGVAAAEAMAAGRLVLSYVGEGVRERTRELHGRDLPIVEVTADTIEQTLRDVVYRREHYRAIAAQGPEFARAVHDGRQSAEVLRDFLLGPT